MIEDYIKYLTNDYKVAHAVLPFGVDDFILIVCDSGLYTVYYVNERRWMNIGSFQKMVDNWSKF